MNAPRFARTLGARLGITALALGAFAAGALTAPLGSARAKDGDDLPAKAYFSPGGEIEPALLELIKNARGEIIVAIFNFTSRPLCEALARAEARGVDVRVILDKHEAFMKYGKIADLRKAKVPVKLMNLAKTGDNQQIRFHHKFMVVDREVVATGSFNWTTQADESNWENEVILGSKRLAAEFKAQFEKAWTMAEEDKPPVKKSEAPGESGSGPGARK